MAQLAVSLAGAALGNFIAPGATFLGMSSAGIGFAAGGLIYGAFQKLPGVEGPRLQDGKITSSAYGQAIPKVFGTVSVAGNIIDASEVRETAHRTTQGGKGGPKQTVTNYSYDADVAVLVAEGEIDAILQIYINEELVYDATPGATVVQKDWLSFTFYPGTEDQTPDPTLEAIHGAGSVPAYKGLAYVVFRKLPFQSNSASANFRFVVSRSATPSTSESEIDLPAAATHIGYSPRAGVIFVPMIYASPQTAGADTVILCGIDPYSRSLVWQTSATDGDEYHIYGHAQLCAHPNYEGLPEAVNTAICVTRDGAIEDTTLAFFDAMTGALLTTLACPNSVDDGYFAFLRPEFLTMVKYQTNGIGVTTLDLMNFAVGGYADTEIDPPAGYDWYSEMPPVSNGDAVVVLALEKTAGSTPALAVLDVTGESYQTISAVDLPANSDYPLGAVWDDNESCWWIIGNTTGLANDNVRIYSLTTAGTLTTYDMSSLYSDQSDLSAASGHPALWLDEYDGVLWWQTDAGTAYAWNPVTQDASATYTGGSNIGGVVYHRGTRTVWGTEESGASQPHIAYGLHTAGITGSAASLQSIVDDLCDGTEIQASDTDTDDLAAVSVRGFAITRDMPRRDAIQALRSVYLFDVVPRDGVLTGIIRGGSPSVTLDEDDLGAHIDGGSPPDAAITIRQRAEAQLPIQMDVTYISSAQNYEPVTQTARRLASLGGTSARFEAPVVLTEAEGAQLADVLLHLSHIASEEYEGAAMPSRIADCQPGDVVTATVDGESYTWRLESASVIDGGIIDLRGQRDDASIYESFAVGGSLRTRSRAVEAVGITLLWPLDVPAVRAGDNDAGVYLAAGSYTPGWPGAEVHQSTDGETYGLLAALDTHASVGVVTNSVDDWAARQWDTQTVLNVRPINSAFSSLSWPLAASGGNLAAWGASGRWEIVSFTTASLQADGTYNISGLGRGLRDTIQYADDHRSGDLFVIISESRVSRIRWSADQYGVARTLKGVTIGKSIPETVAQSVTPGGGALKPFAPCRLHASLSGTTWTLSWMRQDKAIGKPFQQAVNTEASESYQIRILDSLGTVLATRTASTNSLSYTSAMQIADYGGEVYKIYFQVAQVSAVVGAGHWSDVCIAGKDYPLTDAATGGTALTSGYYGPGFEPANAFDDNAGTYWQANTTLAVGSWIGYNLGTAKMLEQVTVKQYQFAGGNHGYASSAAVEYSDDGSSWTTLHTITLAQNTNVQTFDLPVSSAHQYWRLRSTGAVITGYRWAVFEVELMAPDI